MIVSKLSVMQPIHLHPFSPVPVPVQPEQGTATKASSTPALKLKVVQIQWARVKRREVRQFAVREEVQHLWVE